MLRTHPKTLSGLFSLFCILSLASCMTSKKMDRHVSRYFDEAGAQKQVKSSPQIEISSPLVTTAPGYSTTVSKTSNLLPLLLYWQFDYSNTCTLNPKIALDNFSNVINGHAAKSIIPKLGNKQLRLVVTRVPQDFQVLDKSNLIFLGIAFVGWDRMTIRTLDQSLMVDYQVMENGAVLKTGRIVRPILKDERGIMYKKWNVAIGEYLDSYRRQIDQLSKEALTELILEI